MNEKARHIIAFKQPIAPSEFDNVEPPKLWEFRNNPAFVIREYPWDGIPMQNTPDLRKLEQDMVRNLAELSERYGINVPLRFTKVAKNEKGVEKLYLVADKITLLSIDSLSRRERLRFNRAYKELLFSLMAYYGDKIRSKEEWLSEVIPDDFMHQYVYGERAGDTENRLWFVDVDPYITRTPMSADQAKYFAGQISDADSEGVTGIAALFKRYERLMKEVGQK